MRETKYHFNIKIDKLTNSILNTISGDSFLTDIAEVTNDEGVPGNLVAFACKQSLDKGYEGFVSFQSKSALIEHYEKTLGAVHVGGQKMVIFPHEALILIKKYFQI